MSRQEMYFCLKLTENEHYIVEDMIKTECERLGLKLLYYRQLKEGHWPMYREVKIVGDVGLFKPFLETIEDNVEINPYRNPQLMI